MPSCSSVVFVLNLFLFLTRCSYADILCQTPGCLKSAEDIRANMDPGVEPCENFYKFACGNFLKTSVIPPDRASVSTFSKIEDRLSSQIKTVLEEPEISSGPKIFNLMKKFYATCMDEDTLDRLGVQPMKVIIDKLGGLPVVDGDRWDASRFSWINTTYKLRELGFNHNLLINIGAGPDFKNSTRRRLLIDQVDLKPLEDFLREGWKNKNVRAYHSYMVKTAILFGAPVTRAFRELKDSIDFEITMTKFIVPDQELRNLSYLYNLMSVHTLNKYYPTIPWLEFLNTIIGPKISISANEMVMVTQPKYMSSIERLLQVTPKRVLANYMLMQTVLSSSAYLCKSARRPYHDFKYVLTGVNSTRIRSQRCVDEVAEKFSLAVGSLYVRHFFDRTSKENALELVNNLRQEMDYILQNVSWMDPQTKRNALDKSKVLKVHIGYPDELLDDEEIDLHYRDLDIVPGDLLTSVLNLYKKSVDYAYTQLHEPINKTSWKEFGSVATVNAFNHIDKNAIEFPAGILQEPYFAADRPCFLNYGAIGTVIGHEITHTFDDEGSQYDKYGNVMNWWDDESKMRYNEKAACIIKQYSNYVIEDIGFRINGITTQGENIADNGGVKESYRAYLECAKQKNAEYKLPGLEKFSDKQMFWISFANVWCTKYRKEAMELLFKNDDHPPAEIRVNGPLSNSYDFARDFKCYSGSKMNPKHKCEVW
ncbi:hypothetical protein WDU94_004053 [Cyamophila willieti]